MTDYEDDFYEDEDDFYEDEDDIPYEVVRDYVVAQAMREEQKRIANMSVWDTPGLNDDFAEALEEIQAQIGRPLTMREVDRFIDQLDQTHRGPHDVIDEVLLDPALSTSEGRRSYMAERLQEGEPAEPHTWNPANDEPADEEGE